MPAKPLRLATPAPETLDETAARLADRPEAPPLAEAGQVPGRLLIAIRSLSVVLDRSVAALYRDDAAGRLPTGLKIGGSKRWRYSEIIDWVNAGCPIRSVWEAMRDGKARR